MEKRLFLAIILSILVLMVYSALVAHFAPPQPIPPVQPPSATPSTSSVSYKATAEITPSPTPTAILPASELKEKLQTWADNYLTLGVNLVGSGLKQSTLNHYKASLMESNIGLLSQWQGAEFSKNDVTDYLSMSYNDRINGINITKNYKFTSDPYIIEMGIEFITTSNINKYVQYSLNIGSIEDKVRRENPQDERYLELSISLPDKVLRNNFFGFNPQNAEGKIQWLGIRDRYFCSIVKPLQEGGKIVKTSHSGITSYLLEVPSFELSPNQNIKHTYLIYLGPQNPEMISKLGSNAEQIINFGMFDSLSHILLGALELLYKISRNWGIAILLFSLLVFIILSPLSIKSFSSMKKMQELQPVIEELRLKYKDNPQKMNKEVLEMYRAKKINPFGGCLPLLLQMPIFIALYQTLMRFIELKGAKFLWIKDLAEPDRAWVFKQSFPVIGNEINILPLIMIVTMLIQQKMSTTSALQSSETAKQQKMMGLFMSVFFGVIFYKMPSGLVLYWAFNSVLMLLFQKRIMASKA